MNVHEHPRVSGVTSLAVNAFITRCKPGSVLDSSYLMAPAAFVLRHDQAGDGIERPHVTNEHRLLSSRQPGESTGHHEDFFPVE